ncbi:PLAC8 family-domain-containing protein [Suillus americanus]|nr:PLAC8 family-domain-containing protein [Suillus americanus]
MNASEVPQKEGKLADQSAEQSQKKEGEGSGSGAGQPGQQDRPRNYWHNGLFSCWDDVGTCESHSILPQVNQSTTCFTDCMSCWCPCMVYGQNRKRLDHLQDNDMPDPELGGSGCDADCCMHLALNVLCGFGWVLQLGQRATLRERYHIDGSPVNDCLTAFFCTPCELTQESRELTEDEMAITNNERQTHNT